ncbi:MAG: hypothetical protein J0L84_02170 [Verrucomicrobia bacterium]|nr:hypothetical protein [Verrucomicrobiota bacterium]
MKTPILVMLLVAVLAAGCEKPSDAHLKYTGWCKVHGATNLTFEEWDALRKAELLPEQMVRDSDSEALRLLTIITGMSAMSSAGSRR